MHSGNSKVAAGRIARFTPTRLCCSRILSFQDTFSTPLCGKRVETLVITNRNLRSIPGIIPVWTFLYVQKKTHRQLFFLEYIYYIKYPIRYKALFLSVPIYNIFPSPLSKIIFRYIKPLYAFIFF
jgi:hypothetical protein